MPGETTEVILASLQPASAAFAQDVFGAHALSPGLASLGASRRRARTASGTRTNLLSGAVPRSSCLILVLDGRVAVLPAGAELAQPPGGPPRGILVVVHRPVVLQAVVGVPALV